jgi:1-acyl-sn-glycerol-3-phosphate acyltransferase
LRQWRQKLFFLIVIKPIVTIAIGLRIVHKERLPKSGPAIVVANHNSHLDTMVIMTLFPLYLLSKLRPVAAEDYFFQNIFLRWFSLDIINIIPLPRQQKIFHTNLFNECDRALQNGEILIIYPEGSRGEPERLSQFKSGIAYLAKSHPEVPVYPIFIHGLGKSLPKGEALFVPFFCDVFIGDSIRWNGSKSSFMELLKLSIQNLSAEGIFPEWE